MALETSSLFLKLLQPGVRLILLISKSLAPPFSSSTSPGQLLGLQFKPFHLTGCIGCRPELPESLPTGSSPGAGCLSSCSSFWSSPQHQGMVALLLGPIMLLRDKLEL